MILVPKNSEKSKILQFRHSIDTKTPGKKKKILQFWQFFRFWRLWEEKATILQFWHYFMSWKPEISKGKGVKSGNFTISVLGFLQFWCYFKSHRPEKSKRKEKRRMFLCLCCFESHIFHGREGGVIFMLFWMSRWHTHTIPSPTSSL